MIHFGKWVVKWRIPILIIAVILMIPSALGYLGTRVNYDILSYLPGDIDTMIGQDIMMDEFGKGGFSFVIIDGMSDEDVSKTRKEISKVDGVADVLWYDSIADISIPKEVLPEKLYDVFNKGDSTMMAVFFEDTTSADRTLSAVEEIRDITSDNCFLAGMSAVTADMKLISNTEVPIYALLAVIFVTLVLILTTESFLLPVFFMLSIGVALILNLGTNYFFGEVSFLTQALAMVLQLGVTMDYSIFLWHSYTEQKIRFNGDNKRAMAHAISHTFVSVSSSSLTTVAGFLAMCFMSFTLGLDLGIVMSKGVVFGVIGCVTVLPSMILIFDKPIEKLSHRSLLPSLDKIGDFIVKRFPVFLILGALIFIPAFYGYNNYNVYYDLAGTLPAELESVVANSKLSENFGMNSTHMLLIKTDMDPKKTRKLTNEIKEVEGVRMALSFDSLIGPTIPEEIIPEKIKSILKGNEWQMMLIGSDYKVASDEVNEQISTLNNIIKEYDDDALLIGEAPATSDLIRITNKDFDVVSIVSIGLVFLIILVTFKSITVPIILTATIELAIIINVGVSYFTGTTLPFIASIVVGTIQLGSTVDYAILMTTRYQRERSRGADKKESVSKALKASLPSIVVSALGFFAATIGIGFYSKIGMISTLCMLLARGALISMVVVATVLPALLMLLDKVIIHTSMGFLPKKDKKQSAAVSADSSVSQNGDSGFSDTGIDNA